MAARVRRDTDGLLQQEGLDAGIAWAAASISGGVIAYSAGIMTIDTQSSAATDDLDQITGGIEGRLLFVGNANVNRQIVLKHLAGASGNIYMSNQQDLTLADPQVPVMLIYKGSNWVVLNYGLTSIVNDPLEEGDVDEGETPGCVAAGRLRNYIEYVIDQVYAQLPSSTLVLAGILKQAFEIVTPVTNMTPIITLASLLANNAAYGSQANFDTVFTTGEYEYLQCVLDLNQTTGGSFAISDIDNARADLDAANTDASVIFSDILGIITYLGANAALTTDEATASPIDCDTCFACGTITQDWDADTGDATWAFATSTYPFSYHGDIGANAGTTVATGGRTTPYRARSSELTGWRITAPVCILDAPCKVRSVSFWVNPAATGQATESNACRIHINFHDENGDPIYDENLYLGPTTLASGCPYNAWTNFTWSGSVPNCKYVTLTFSLGSATSPGLSLDDIEING